MLKRENDPLKPGTAMPLVAALLKLNRFQQEGCPPLVEVVVMSKNSPETGVRVLNSIRGSNISISRYAFTGGESVIDYLDAYDVDLFLTTSVEDAQRVIDGGACPAAVVKPPPDCAVNPPEDQVRIAFDGDAVLFSEESEIVYKAKGLGAFHDQEDALQNMPMGDGPYASLLRKLARLQEKLPFSIEYSPVRIAIVTARNAPAEMRVIKTLRHWGVYVDELFFLGGVAKAKVLIAFRPHIFFDDQDLHLKEISHIYPAGRVPYATGSPLAESPDDSTV